MDTLLINKVREDMISARKGGDPVAKSLLVTFYSEASMVGKNKRNGDPTDEEVIATARKFITNAEDTLRLLQERGQPSTDQHRELELLQVYVPAQLDREQLDLVVRGIIDEMKLEGPRAMGAAMAELKRVHAGRYDGKMASELVKRALS